MPKVVGILQARVSSSRLPGKVLKPLLGEPMLIRQVERIRRAKKIDCLIIATSNESSDDPIEKLCFDYNISCFRGSLDDVLDRFYHAAKSAGADYVVRMTGDCPLTDPEIIESVIQFCLENQLDYVSNALEPTFPDGLDVEVFRFSCLEAAWKEARLTSEREHVTPFIYNHTDRFKVASYNSDVDLSHLRWTVDEPDDFKFVTEIYELLYRKNPSFSSKDILDILADRSELTKINSMHGRNEGYEKSLKKDICINPERN